MIQNHKEKLGQRRQTPKPTQEKRTQLIESLVANNAFWSYDNISEETLNDEILISKTLQHLDIKEINQLFKMFPVKKIKKVWLDALVPQGEYLYTLNKFLAWYYFGAKRPGQYVRAMETRYINRQFV